MFWLTALSNGVQVVFLLFPATLFLLLWHWRIVFTRRVLSRLIVLYGVGAALCVPFYAPLFAEVIRPDRTADLRETGWVTYSTDLLGFVSPSPFTPWGKAFAPEYTRQVLGTNTVEGAAYIGLIVGALAIIGLLHYRKQARIWLFVALGCMLFSLGPLLKILDQPVVYRLGDEIQSNVVLPYALIQSLPFISSTRTPGRYNLVTGLALAIIAAFGLIVLLDRIKRANLRILITGVLAILILADYQLFLPAMTTPATIPPYMSELAKRDDVRAVFDLPWDNNLVAKEAIHYQTVHGKPLIAGHVVRRTPVNPAKLRLIERTLLLPTDRLPYALPFLESQGVDVIIAHKPFATSEQIGTLQGVGETLYEDDRVAIFLRNKPAAKMSSALYTLGTGDFYLSEAIAIRLTGADDFYTINHERVGRGETVIVQLPPGFYDQPNTVTAQRAPNFIPGNVQVGGLRYRGTAIEQPGNQLKIGTLWQVDTVPPTDYHYFLHVMDANGKIADQRDVVPLFPPTQWKAGQQWYENAVFSSLPPGVYTLYAGWYSYPDLTRLPVQGDGKGARDGLIYLGEVTIDSNRNGGQP
jgi:hypothetical protein